MAKSKIIIVVMAIIIAGSDAQVPFFGSCPTVTIKNDFVPTSYLGLWYEHAKYFAIFQFAGKCVTATYSPINGTTIDVFNQQINFITNQPVTIRGYATLKGPSNIADLRVVFPTTPFPAPYQVLETDYNNYAVVFSCTDLGIFHFKFLWILTRSRIPPASVLNDAYAVMDRNKLSRLLLLKTDQTNCPATNP